MFACKRLRAFGAPTRGAGALAPAAVRAVVKVTTAVRMTAVAATVVVTMVATAGGPLSRAALAGEEPAPEVKKGLRPDFIKDGKPDVEAILKYFNDLYRSDSSIGRATLTVVKPRRTRTLRMRMWTRGEEKSLVVVEGPAKYRGTATLKVDENLWSYDPKIARTIRIPPSMMLGSWMGSDFTNDDIVRESSYVDDYDARLVGRTKKPDPEGWLINMDIREGVVGLWKRMEFVVSLDGTLPLTARYYDRKGRLSRTMVFSEVRDFGGRRVPARMTLTPIDEKKEGQSTTFVYEEIDFDAKVPDSKFDLSELERKR